MEKEIEKNMFNEMANPNRPELTENVKMLLLTKPSVAADLEVYSFVLQRFRKQLVANFISAI